MKKDDKKSAQQTDKGNGSKALIPIPRWRQYFYGVAKFLISSNGNPSVAIDQVAWKTHELGFIRGILTKRCPARCSVALWSLLKCNPVQRESRPSCCTAQLIGARHMGFVHTLRWVAAHPLTHAKLGSAITRYLRWQFGSRILGQKIIYPWVNETRLVVGLGDTGLTGNIYCGLHEFEDMSFILHALRATDCFVDVGANCGSYTVLAAGAVGCRAISIEPSPNAFARLLDNVHLNRIETKVECLNIGVGANEANQKFSSELDTVNHVLTEQEDIQKCIVVPIKPLDTQLIASDRTIIKIDVEGYETNVIRGASEIMASENVYAVVMELNGSGLRYGFDDAALHKSMLDFGFLPCRYSPLERKIEQLDGINRSSGNTIYVKNYEFVERRVKSAAAFVIFGRQI